METPYVVRSHAASQLHEEMPCWEFSHPVEKSGMCVRDSAKDVDNERSAQVTFQIDKDSGRNYGSGYQEQNDKLMPLLESSKEAGKDSLKTNIIHGYLGTFHCTLYRSVAGGEEKASTISIAPNSFSVGMFSWFPLYFPLREPQVVPQGSNVRCNMWRRCDEERVWYEWCSEIFHEKNIVAVSNVHNPNGRSCFVRL
jgi:protein arginine N-methyltransferase 5